ncbi:MAG: gluconate 2-dehydrogenase subunit 3 family protein [Gammaproteobacteria bacterium]|nr:gluconate 2-dehydrogenase subunit 3 family protein [Gammaproteobacteria bacterium]
MVTSRRHFLHLGFWGALSLKLRGVFAASISTGEGTDSSVCLSAFLDTLIPDHETFPGASHFGISEAILLSASVVPAHRKLIDNGCRWLDIQSKKRYGSRFDGLREGQRAHIVRIAESAPDGSLPRVFLLRTLEDAMERYYARPEVWTVLGFEGPPQPRGYPEFALTPMKVD